MYYFIKANENQDNLELIENVSVTLTKSDIGSIFNQLSAIKENINKIKSSFK